MRQRAEGKREEYKADGRWQRAEGREKNMRQMADGKREEYKADGRGQRVNGICSRTSQGLMEQVFKSLTILLPSASCLLPSAFFTF
jgi:hypothetical protein